MYNYLAGLVCAGAILKTNKLTLRHKNKRYLEQLCKEARRSIKAYCYVRYHKDNNTYELVILKDNIYDEIYKRLKKRKINPIKSYIKALIDVNYEIYDAKYSLIFVNVSNRSSKIIIRYLNKKRIPYLNIGTINRPQIVLFDLNQLTLKGFSINPLHPALDWGCPPTNGERELGLDTGLEELYNAAKELGLSRVQHEIIIGTLLGDGRLDISKHGNARLQVRHSIKQAEYVEFKRAALNNIVASNILYKYYDNRTKKEYIQIGFNTQRHRYFTILANLFYKDRRKVIPENILRDAGEIALAIFIADDGTYDSNSKTIKISVDNYSYEDKVKLRKWLKQKFNIDSSIEKDRIYIYRRNYYKLLNLVLKFTPLSMRYKLAAL